MIDDKDIEKLIKAQKEVFVTKGEFEGLMEVVAMKDDLERIESKLEDKLGRTEFLKSQDEILTELKSLRQEKTMADGQDKRKTKVLEIHNTALKSNKILSEQQATEIDGLRAF